MEQLNSLTLGLIDDLKQLRANQITNADARVRAQLAREILRAVHYHLQGVALIEAKTKAIEEAK